ncbi:MULTISPECIES: fimbrial protein [unclassified Caballeronia]|uniref:fimbrial protein n=1 Tax=unclassified Caballeronia TaxID=2646786 RepID=UPI001F30F909|nr:MULTISPECIES: fimbrial protein [unclassified Caballeronia]MCE4544692.1 type 1 fimbrial protein [Caballeronia sp. PC1]MCE4571843.1 type 1 fimbrial protein [Caballeronia sp. CLC5]
MNEVNALQIEGLDMKKFERYVFARIRLLLCGVAALLALPGSAWATATCHSASSLNFTLGFPATVAVARDLPDGSPLTGWVSTPMTNNYWTCDITGSWYSGTDFEVAGIIPSSPTSFSRTYNGKAFPVYKTNVPGVGMALGGYIYTNGRTNGPLDFPHLGFQWNQNGSAVNNGGQLIASLVKIGDITPGTVSGQLAQAFSWESATKTAPPGNLDLSAGIINFDMTPVVITVLTCQTPDVNIDMGTQTPADFPSIGAPSGKSTAFKLSFNNCPAGTADTVDTTNRSGLIHSVTYRITPTSSDRMVAGYSNVVALDDGASQAGGIGIQLYDSNGTVVPLSTDMPLTGFDGTRSGSYNVAMTARYFRTGAITAGTANATMLMTVQYQ